MKTITISRRVMKTENILYIQAAINYSLFHFKDGSTFLSSFTLKKIENHLDSEKFKRINRGLVVNSKYIKYTSNGHIVLIDNSIFKISRRKQECFRKYPLD